MLNRPIATYDFDPAIIERILNNPVSPLNRISEIIPDNAKVLDVGAGEGLLARVLGKKRKNVIIDGIEPDSYAAGLARSCYRRFYAGTFQDYAGEVFQEKYDFIVLADVIEHTEDPLSFLQELYSRSSRKTKLILSVPNIAFGAVRLSLLNGEFTYVESGLLGRTHFRFFTLKTLEELVSEAGMHIEKLFFLQRNLFETEISLGDLDFSPFCLTKILRDDLSSSYQFILVLNKQPVSRDVKWFGEKTKHPLYSFIRLRIGRLLKEIGVGGKKGNT